MDYLHTWMDSENAVAGLWTENWTWNFLNIMYDVELKITAWKYLGLWHLINLIFCRMVIVELSKAGICAEIWIWDFIDKKQ